jgi:dihydrofolate reductase
MGRNMFGPARGSWNDEQWSGWWGDNPPFHHDVFVLTHHQREPLVMHGGTTFHFVDCEIRHALDLAATAAHGKDVSIGGGAFTIRQFLNAGLIDEVHFVLVPVLLGRGERLFEIGDRSSEIYECVERVVSPSVTHFNLARKLGHS